MMRSRTATLGYAFPPALPVALPADQCTRDDLLDIAAGAAQQHDQLLQLMGSQEHVAAICKDYSERMDMQLRDARDEIRELQNQLTKALRRTA